jgi:NADPH-dependent curcumin reductase CurA
MRIWITGVRTYIKGVDLNEVMNGFGVGVVFHSTDPSWKKGDYCTGMLGWQEYAVKKANELQPIH